MSNPLVCVCIDQADEAWFRQRLPGREASLLVAYWHGNGMKVPSGAVVAFRCRNLLSLYRDLPAVRACCADSPFLCLVERISDRFAALPAMQGVRYADAGVEEARLAALVRQEKDAPGRDVSLTRRELQVCQLVAGGCSERKIAERLHISPHTVKTHKEHLFLKFGVRSSLQLAAAARSVACRISR